MITDDTIEVWENVREGILQDKKESKVFFPTSVDINPTAKCNLGCSFCWGSYHTIVGCYLRREVLVIEDWHVPVCK